MARLEFTYCETHDQAGCGCVAADRYRMVFED